MKKTIAIFAITVLCLPLFSQMSQEQQLAQLAAHIAALNASNAEIIRQINEINQRIAALQQSNANMQNNINALQQDLENTKKAWQAANQKLIDQVTNEITKAMRAGTSSTSGSSGRGASSGPRGSGEFLVHRVEAGHTLNAIASAYKVSVEEIKAANNMTSDIIRVGQTLYIPKK